MMILRSVPLSGLSLTNNCRSTTLLHAWVLGSVLVRPGPYFLDLIGKKQREGKGLSIARYQ